MALISTDILRAKDLLDQGKNVAIPTETVYGLAGNIFNEKAIKNIFELKKRPLFNPLIVHIHDRKQLENIAIEIPENAHKLAATFWPGSLTLILKKKEGIPDIITANKDTVGIRMPNHDATLELLKSLDYPLAAPSANPYTQISPTTAQHVATYFEDGLEMVLDGGPCTNGIESTIVGFENEQVVIYRLGAIAVEEIEKIVGPVIIKNNHKKGAAIAPGMVKKHYAPRTKIILVNDIDTSLLQYSSKQIGLLLHNENHSSYKVAHVEYLSRIGDFKESAANLYAALHKLDQMNLDIIIAQKFKNTDLGNSINDRLSRATQ